MKSLQILACLVLPLSAAGALAAGPAPDPVAAALHVSGYSIQMLQAPAAPGASFSVDVRLGADLRRISLEPHSVRAPGFKVMVQDASGALSEVAAPADATYRGHVEGIDGSTVAASLVAGGLSAMVRMPDGAVWTVQPLRELNPGASAGSHAVFRDSDALPGEWGCATDDIHLPLNALRAMAGGAGGAGGGSPDGLLTCELACDADFEFYTLLGSSTANVTTDITNIVNAVSNIYEVDCQIEIVIAQIIIRTSAATNPYSSNAPSTLLGQFRNHWNANHTGVARDLAHLFTGRNIDGSVIGIAYLAGICNTNAYGLSQSRYTTNFALRTALTAHETGHNFNAQHCNTLCTPCEIMCSGLGGCSGIVNSFSTCDIASITAYAATRPCLAPPPPPPPPVLALPFFDPFPNLTLDILKWPTVVEATLTTIAQNERSAPNAMLLPGVASAQTAHLNTDAVGLPVFISLWTQHTGVEAGKELRVRAYNPSTQQYDTLLTIVSSGTDQDRFAYSEVTLPLQNFSETESRVRIEVTGPQQDDFWFVDDVGVSPWCRADINKDRALSIADFGAFQSAFASANLMIADFNDDGNLSIADFGTFQARFAQGCY